MVRIYAAVVLCTLAVFPSSLLVTIFTGSHRIAHRMHARFWGRAILRTAGVRFRVHGAEHLDRVDVAGSVDPPRGTVLMINHGSHLAGYVAAAALSLQWRAVLDARLRWVPVFGWIGMLAGHVFLDRSRSDRAVRTLARATDRIRGGISVLVFPEGRWNAEARLLPFRKGGFYLAIAAGAPIVPLTVVETERALDARIEWVDLYVGAPIPTAGLIPDALIEATRTAMNAHAVEGRFRRRP